eukprot:6190781-Pleurochrysis_carterae.AAC.1
MLVRDKRAGLLSRIRGRQLGSWAGKTSKIQESACDDTTLEIGRWAMTHKEWGEFCPQSLKSSEWITFEAEHYIDSSGFAFVKSPGLMVCRENGVKTWKTLLSMLMLERAIKVMSLP